MPAVHIARAEAAGSQAAVAHADVAPEQIAADLLAWHCSADDHSEWERTAAQTAGFRFHVDRVMAAIHPSPLAFRQK